MAKKPVDKVALAAARARATKAEAIYTKAIAEYRRVVLSGGRPGQPLLQAARIPPDVCEDDCNRFAGMAGAAKAIAQADVLKGEKEALQAIARSKRSGSFYERSLSSVFGTNGDTITLAQLAGLIMDCSMRGDPAWIPAEKIEAAVVARQEQSLRTPATKFLAASVCEELKAEASVLENCRHERQNELKALKTQRPAAIRRKALEERIGDVESGRERVIGAPSLALRGMRSTLATLRRQTPESEAAGVAAAEKNLAEAAAACEANWQKQMSPEGMRFGPSTGYAGACIGSMPTGGLEGRGVLDTAATFNLVEE